MRVSTYLWSGHVTSSPSHEGDGQRGRLLCLAGNVARDQGKDQVSLGEIELCAVKGDE